jgi:cell division protein ZapA (FtsZ GTPase activity inhibitor)
MSNDAITNYKNKLSQSESQAENGIRSAISSIANEVITSMRTLKANGQKITINADEIVADLNTARDKWLSAVKGVFDAAISTAKTELKK